MNYLYMNGVRIALERGKVLIVNGSTEALKVTRFEYDKSGDLNLSVTGVETGTEYAVTMRDYDLRNYLVTETIGMGETEAIDITPQPTPDIKKKDKVSG